MKCTVSPEQKAGLMIFLSCYQQIGPAIHAFLMSQRAETHPRFESNFLMPRHCQVIVVLLTLLTAHGAIAEEPAQRAARSVHLWYQAPAAVWFQNELVVEVSQNGTYFMACGFQHGYFGLQQLRSPDKKVVLFSVWDPGKQDDPTRVADENRVKVLHQGDGVRVKRFGGEGTGAQSFFDYNWKIGETCRFAIRAEPRDKVTAYSAYFYLNDQKKWKHLATFQTQTGGAPLKGFYSFVEDFRRDGRSPNQRRAARFENGWVKTTDGTWVELTKVTFTADRTPLSNINAEVVNDGFRLATGGDTKQQTDLRSRLERKSSNLKQPAIAPPDVARE
jgi:hypothetical protein